MGRKAAPDSQRQIDIRHRFINMAERHTRRVLESLKDLGECSDRSKYLYNDDQVGSIFCSIERAVADEKARFCAHTPVCFRLGGDNND